jgi:16S rRNA G966 N2-methylase RsmD
MSYPGGKNGAGVYQKIINLMPPHQSYYEPFLGGGAILLHKRPAGRNVGIDLNAQAIANFSAGIAMPNKPDPVTKFLAIAAATHRQISPSRNAPARNVICPDPPATIARPGEPGRPLELICADALHFLQNHTFQAQDLIYCDPPYLHATRHSAHIYRHEMCDNDHAVLLEILKTLPCMIMISGYYSELYAYKLARWHPTTYQAMTRAGKQAQEWLWCNFPPPKKLHDYAYTGANFRQRERIKRKIKRWVERLAQLPETERRAILAQLPTPD